MINKLPIAAYLSHVEASHEPILDVRSPKEFLKGHIPGANNLPLFEDDERHLVGLMYKQEGQDPAVRKGYELVGPKLKQFVEKADSISPDRRLAVHCWRGGMRSESMAMLFSQAGFDVSLLDGGYKAYRRYIRKAFEQSYSLIVLGGKTGSGKTDILKALAAQGEQVIDLEALAHHKGSVFGGLMEAPQPTVEQFENEVYTQLSQLDAERRIWVEDESHAIGQVYVPVTFWKQIQQAPIAIVEVPVDKRIQRLIAAYAEAPKEELAACLDRIKRRLGGQHFKRALEAFEAGDLYSATEIALRYYDKAYRYGLEKKAQSPSHTLALGTYTPSDAAQQLIEMVDLA